MPKNVPLSNESYIYFRKWLRGTDILWRDLTDALIVPAWGEAICRRDTLDNDNKTPGERAYNTIRLCFSDLHLRWRKSELTHLDVRPPLYFRHPHLGEVFALDIRKAYCQIYKRLYLHADWPFKRLKYPLAEIALSLEKDKLGRNAVVGICRSTRNKWVRGPEVWYQKKQNRYLSPVLWGHIMGILNQVAAKMIGFGAVYVHTDGYAFTTFRQAYTASQYLEDFGLQYKMQSGSGEILGISHLSIKGIKEPKGMVPSGEVIHLEPNDQDYLTWWSKLNSY